MIRLVSNIPERVFDGVISGSATFALPVNPLYFSFFFFGEVTGNTANIDIEFSVNGQNWSTWGGRSADNELELVSDLYNGFRFLRFVINGNGDNQLVEGFVMVKEKK